MENKTNKLKAKSLKLREMMITKDGSVVSKEILNCPPALLPFFAFDAGQGLSRHTPRLLAPLFIS